MIWCWEFREEEESRPYCFVDFWRKPPPLIGFGVERHTLAHRRYHPGISLYFLGASIAVAQHSQWGRKSVWGFGELHKIRVQIAVSFQPIWDPSRAPSIEPSIVGFWQWNLAYRLIQPFRVQLFPTDIWGCIQCIRADPSNSFRPNSAFGETIVLSHISSNSIGGILWGTSSVPGGAQTPQGSRSRALPLYQICRTEH